MPFETLLNAQQQSILLRNNDNSCSAEILCVGAVLNKFEINTSQGRKNIIDGFSNGDEAFAKMEDGYKSAKLSPFVCRLAKGEYTFNNQPYSLQCNMPPHAIHGLLYTAPFKVINTHSDNNSASVTLEYRYEAHNSGYPFHYTLTVQWTFKEGNQLSVTTTAKNTDTKAIPFADGWHPYFTLSSTIDDCTLQMDTTQLVEFDATLIPTSTILNDDRFVKPLQLKGIELDNCFVLDTKTNAGCVLESDLLKLTIQPHKSYPYMQVYTPPHRTSIAIENLSSVPDAFNNKIGLLVLQPNETKNFTTTYSLNTNK